MDLVVIRFKNTKQWLSQQPEFSEIKNKNQFFIQSSHFRFLLKTYSVVFHAEICC